MRKNNNKIQCFFVQFIAVLAQISVPITLLPLVLLSVYWTLII